MTTTDVDRVFVDTSVWLHAAVEESPHHGSTRAALEPLLSDVHVELFVSGQVVRELLVRFTHPQTLSAPLDSDQAVAAVQKVLGVAGRLEESSASTIAQLFELVSQFQVRGKQIHDCCIVATMLVHDVRRLMTRNPADFRRYVPLIELIELP